MKAYRIPILIIVLLVTVQVLFELYRPKPIDWSESFERKDKIPHGCYVAYQLLTNYFGEHTVSVVNQPIYNKLGKGESPMAKEYSDSSEYATEQADTKPSDKAELNEKIDDKSDIAKFDDTIRYSAFADMHKGEQYLFVTKYFAPDNLDITYLLQFVETGGTVFIAAESLADSLAHLLRVETNWQYTAWSDTALRKVVFEHPQLKKTGVYSCRAAYLERYFSRLDTARTTILGGIDAEHPNFVRIDRGKGAFFLHSSPLLFGNYTTVQDSGSQYIAHVFAHLPSPALTYWDEYYKPNHVPTDSPLRYVLSAEALRWAIYLSLIGLALLMLFESKRRQRAIPVIEPLRNTTLDFARTVGMLYYQHGDHRDLGNKKIAHFGDYLRNRLFLPPIQFDRDYYTLVAQKAELPLADIEAIFRLIVQVRTQVEINPDTLLDLNQHIDAFYAHVG